ncbi:FAD-dependent oxidoreductase [Sulfurimonas sp.]|uniref:NAD(P)/FAD-dependent oxidoreductase n=1 Tax=Sulfurimonas sp. TaxID=2022749 RepID=UPI002608AB02|nr:FAD-dependent oxidoreductase [Sulfurimonas sp.]
MKSKKQVLVLGGGYGGIKALETFAHNDFLDVTLIDKNRYHYLQTESYNLVALQLSLEDIIIPLDRLVQGIDKRFQFIQDEIINIQETKVICRGGEYCFDYLLVAVGVQTFLPSLLKHEKLYEVKNLSNALYLKQHFENTIVKHFQKEQQLSNIIVIGGGSSGVEIAAEMQNYINESNLKEEVKISLIADLFLTELDETSREKALDTLQDMGIHIIKKMVTKVQNNKVYFENETIAFDFGVVAVGLSAHDFIEKLYFPKEKNLLKVDAYLRLYKNIFAAGDCALLEDRDGKSLPQTAQTAEQSGVVAAENIMRCINNKPLIKADIKIYGLAIALGGKFAIATASFIKVDGLLGYLGKKAIEQYYKISLKLKI